MLITSACGSEGKTTLAAQLAERCVNAGMMTLLIDGDLRNPTLSRMLDAADSPGLINVLRGEMAAEDVVSVIGEAGGFHLIPAGTPRRGPEPVVAKRPAGQTAGAGAGKFRYDHHRRAPRVAGARRLDDGPLDRGAVLAVRYDTSRFPLVERANRRSAHVGVPVIGAVVNGVRTSDSYYGVMATEVTATTATTAARKKPRPSRRPRPWPTNEWLWNDARTAWVVAARPRAL